MLVLADHSFEGQRKNLIPKLSIPKLQGTKTIGLGDGHLGSIELGTGEPSQPLKNKKSS
jgi:hypothetical protein